jgi:inosine triphosphate pyrophosphatase
MLYFPYMSRITFITGNQNKADYLAKYLGFPVDHMKLDLDELQSMDLKVIVEHKVRQAFEMIKTPVIVEDVALEFEALGGLPGPFIKFFLSQMSNEAICSLIKSGQTRKATARCVFGYFDGTDLELFEGSLDGEVPETPYGDKGFGWDQLYIPKGYSVTRASLDEDDDRKTYLLIKPFAQLKAYLESRNK